MFFLEFNFPFLSFPFYSAFFLQRSSNISIHTHRNASEMGDIRRCSYQTTEIRTFSFSEFNISDLISFSRASLTEGDKHIDSN